MTLPLRWRVACAVTSLLAVAALASPASAANVTSVSLPDASGDTQPSGVSAAQADITMSTATFKSAEIAFTTVTASPEDPRTSPNWAQPATKISWLIRTTSAAPAFDYELRYQMSSGALVANVFSASDPGNALCAAMKVDYSGKTYRASIDPACIGSPRTIDFAASIAYQYDPNTLVTDGPDNGNFSADLVRPELGYWLVGRDGGIFAFGDAPFLGSTGNIHLNQPIVGMAETPTGKGYWFVAADGGVFAFGDAGFFGSTGAMKLNKPIVGMAPTRSGLGYYLVASDGGIFAFGDAKFRGSTGNIKLNKPIVGMATSPNGRGYWLVASDGGVFAFGNGADFFGSTGNIRLAQPIVGIAPTNRNKGYWFVAADGGIFAFGDAMSFTPKLGGAPVTGVTAAPDGKGLWVTRADGTVNAYGSAPDLGGLKQAPAQPIVGIAAM
jgi:ribosomal protein L24E